VHLGAKKDPHFDEQNSIFLFGVSGAGANGVRQ
jgi:hypothetical protein